MWVEVGVGAVHLDFLLVINVMAAEPKQVVNSERTGKGNAVAIVLETTRKVRIVVLLETFHPIKPLLLPNFSPMSYMKVSFSSISSSW